MFVKIARTALAAFALACAAGTTAAQAAEYHVWGCRTPAGAPAPTDGWALQADNDTSGYVQTCQSGGQIGVTDVGSGGFSTTMVYTVPPTLRPLGGRFWRTAKTKAVESDSAFSLLEQPEGAIGKTLGIYFGQLEYVPGGDTVRGNAAAPFDVANLVTSVIPTASQETTNAFRLSATCQGTTNPCDVRYLISAYDIKLSDPTPPRSTAIGGTIIAEGNGLVTTPVRGTQTAVVLGADDGSGFFRAILQVDGQDVTASPAVGSSTPARCTPATASDGQRAYVLRQPCPLTGSSSLSWDTSQAADGFHDVAIQLEDGAGNRVTVTSGRVAVRNSPTTGPGSPIEFRGGPNGSSADDRSTLSLTWPSTAKVPSKATAKRCVKQPKWAAKHPVQCVGRPAASAVTAAWSGTRALAVGGVLRDSAGTPISGATVHVDSTSATNGAETDRLATLTTDANGAFATAAPLARGSRTIRAQWRARTEDTVPAASASAALSVRAGATFSSPRRIRAGATARFSGAISATGLPAGGRTVSLQSYRGGGWKTFDEPRTDAKGHWKSKLKLRVRASYRLRVVVEEIPTYPFARGTSAVRTLRVG